MPCRIENMHAFTRMILWTFEAGKGDSTGTLVDDIVHSVSELDKHGLIAAVVRDNASCFRISPRDTQRVATFPHEQNEKHYRQR